MRLFQAPASRSFSPSREWYPLSATSSAGSSGVGAAPTAARLASAASSVPGRVAVSPWSAAWTSAATPAAVATDRWSGYAGLPTRGYVHGPVDPGTPEAALPLPGIRLVFGLAKRWLLGTHHGAVSRKHLPAYLDEYVSRFNRHTAKRVSHGFARLVEQAVRTRPATYRAIVAGTAAA